jgi:uncharacterized RDD family membrane protein YckC
VDADTLGRPSGWQLLVRMVGYVPSLLALGWGFWVVLFDPRRQGWHDKWANTLVISETDGAANTPSFKLNTRPPTSRLDNNEPPA